MKNIIIIINLQWYSLTLGRNCVSTLQYVYTITHSDWSQCNLDLKHKINTYTLFLRDMVGWKGETYFFFFCCQNNFIFQGHLKKQFFFWPLYSEHFCTIYFYCYFSYTRYKFNSWMLTGAYLKSVSFPECSRYCVKNDQCAVPSQKYCNRSLWSSKYWYLNFNTK